MRAATLALVQFDSVIGDVVSNTRKAISFMQQAGSQQADLIVFPELFLTGYDLDVLGSRYQELAQHEQSEAVRQLCEAAKAAEINAILPMPLRTASGIGNGALAVNRLGEIVAQYAKVHLWAEEQRYFTAGDELIVAAFDFAKVGMMICYDAGFPEAARSLTLKGAEMLVAPSAFTKDLAQRWNIYFATRALENTRFVAAVNGVGGLSEESWLFGNNKVSAPNGELVLDAELDREAMQLLTIDLTLNKEYESSIPYLRDRRADIYSK
ncbi:nitrilase-related carbon-nitrogen hydrolase [Paenibacillus septentrionalis]|uniref:Nitrilase-related carbon-nitrogen hydrolase n=1 Tax=Paenibacillus septentrionalis TaxID=429342 RepID=A0ABW1V4U7_9BACL